MRRLVMRGLPVVLVLFAIVAAFLTSGCAHAPRPVEVKTQLVEVPVRAPCPAPDERARLAKLRPAPLRLTPAPANSLERAAALVAQLLRYEGSGGWADQADAALDRCQQP